MRHTLPAKQAQVWIDRLALSESPAFTARRARREESSGAPQDPIVWKRAAGSNVEDVDGNRYVDLTSGFGASTIGHAHPRVVEAIRQQSDVLVHALGDFHPSDVKIRLLEKLTSLAPWPARAILGLSGADSVEAALKTAVMATGKPGVLAFEGGYHGLSMGALSTCGYSEAFRAPFQEQLNPHVVFAPWAELDRARELWKPDIGAVVVEAIQGRGGIRPAPEGFIAGLADLAHDHGAALIVDEVLTGLGRCGTTWLSDTHADVLCVGKALGGGMPISACLGRTDIMGAWGNPDGEAIHTGTFFGHPLSCAAALASLAVLEDECLAQHAVETGAWLSETLRTRGFEVRGSGLMLGIQFAESVLPLVHRLLARGYLSLPCGTDAATLEVLPPLTIERELLEGFVDVLAEVT